MSPTYIRVWGVGSCFAAGRVGSVIGPIRWRHPVGKNLPFEYLFYIAAIPQVIGFVNANHPHAVLPGLNDAVRRIKGDAMMFFVVEAAFLPPVAAYAQIRLRLVRGEVLDCTEARAILANEHWPRAALAGACTVFRNFPPTAHRYSVRPRASAGCDSCR